MNQNENLYTNHLINDCKRGMGIELKQHGSISYLFNVFFIELRKLIGPEFTKYYSFRVRLIEGRINKSGGSRMPLEYCEQNPSQ